MFLERHKPSNNLAELESTRLMRWWFLTANGTVIKPFSTKRFSESVKVSYFCSSRGVSTECPTALAQKHCFSRLGEHWALWNKKQIRNKQSNFPSFISLPHLLRCWNMQYVSSVLYFVLCRFVFSASLSRKMPQEKWAASEMHRTTALLVHLVINVAWQRGPRDRKTWDGFIGWGSGMAITNSTEEKKRREKRKRYGKRLSLVGRGREQREWALSSVWGSLLFCTRRKELFPAGSHAPCFVTQASSVSIHHQNTERVWRTPFGLSLILLPTCTYCITGYINHSWCYSFFHSFTFSDSQFLLCVDMLPFAVGQSDPRFFCVDWAV